MFRTCLLALALLLAPAATLRAAVDDIEVQALVRVAIGNFIRPAASHFESRAEAAARDMARFCTGPDEAGLARVRADFAALVAAWSVVEIIRFGPVTEEGRLERILPWPDPERAAFGEVEALVVAQDQSATDPRELAGKPPALQGLGALEYVLYGPGSEMLLQPEGSFRCSYGVAIAQNLTAMATATRAAWETPAGISGTWTEFGPDNPAYPSGAAALAQLTNVFTSGLEQLQRDRIDAFLGAEPGADRPEAALFWRSGQTLLSIYNNLLGMQRLLDAVRIEEALPEDARWIVRSARFEFRNGLRAAGSVLVPLDHAVGLPEIRARLDYLRIVTGSLGAIMGRLNAALGLPAPARP